MGETTRSRVDIANCGAAGVIGNVKRRIVCGGFGPAGGRQLSGVRADGKAGFRTKPDAVDALSTAVEGPYGKMGYGI